jgi:hypothetical protein
MKITNETVEQLVDAYQDLVRDYKVSAKRFESIVDSTTESYWSIIFTKVDEILMLEDVI